MLLLLPSFPPPPLPLPLLGVTLLPLGVGSTGGCEGVGEKGVGGGDGGSGGGLIYDDK